MSDRAPRATAPTAARRVVHSRERVSQWLFLGVRTAVSDDPEHGLTGEVLAVTDVLTWWGHAAPGEVDDEMVDRVHRHVLAGWVWWCCIPVTVRRSSASRWAAPVQFAGAASTTANSSGPSVRHTRTRPGDQDFPVCVHQDVRRVIANVVQWARSVRPERTTPTLLRCHTDDFHSGRSCYGSRPRSPPGVGVLRTDSGRVGADRCALPRRPRPATDAQPLLAGVCNGAVLALLHERGGAGAVVVIARAATPAVSSSRFTGAAIRKSR